MNHRMVNIIGNSDTGADIRINLPQKVNTNNNFCFFFHDLYKDFRFFQEARGLDAGRRLVQKLIGFGDHRTSNIVAKIAEEEVAHVAVGVFWFTLLCQKMGRTPSDTFKDLLKGYSVEVKGPFNYAARDKAGMPRDWYDDDSLIHDGTKKRLSEVHDRLATIISMEQESSKLG